MKSKLIAIAAVGLDGTIGIDSQIPWQIPEDFKYFRTTTIGHPIIMGNTTYKTLPEKAFDQRQYVVVGHDVQPRENVHAVKSIPELFEYIDSPDAFESGIQVDKSIIFVAGGEMIYTKLLKYCDAAFITWVNKLYDDGNKLFPITDLFSTFDLFNETPWMTSVSELQYKHSNYSNTMKHER